MNRYKKSDDTSYALGTTLTIELLKTRREHAEMVYVHSQISKNETYRWIEDACSSSNIPLVENDKVFHKLSEKENCFAIGVFQKYENEIVPDMSHLVLVNPSNSGNLGTIIRSMKGFKVDDLAIVLPGADVFDPKTIRASMGAVFNIRFSYFASISAYLESVSERSIYPFMLKGGHVLGSEMYADLYSLIFGNEATGLDDSYLALGTPIRISHENSIDSLSLPVAVSIALYEFTKSGYKN